MSDEESVIIVMEEDYNCPICLCDVPKVDLFTLKQCGCSFCRTCLSEYIRMHIKEKTSHRLKCPGNHIRDFVLQRDEVKKLVGHERFLSFIRQTHEDVVQKDPNRIFCPRPGCGAVCYSKRLGPRPVRCMTCGYKFCRLCLEIWPGPAHSCAEDLNLTAISDNSVKTETSKVAVEKSKKQHLEIKRCPKCGVAIQKAIGCPQMRCSRCGHSFCWFCLKPLDHDTYFQHMMQGTCPSKAEPPNVSCLRRCWIHLSSMGLICCCGVICMICTPFVILCSPCLVLCPPPVPQIFVPEEYFEPLGSPNHLNAGAIEEDTDSEIDGDTKP